MWGSFVKGFEVIYEDRSSYSDIKVMLNLEAVSLQPQATAFQNVIFFVESAALVRVFAWLGADPGFRLALERALVPFLVAEPALKGWQSG